MKKRLIGMTTVICLMFMPSVFAVAPAFAKAIEITVNDHNPAEAPPAQALAYWAKKVNEACGGKAKVTVHHGGALLKATEAYRGTQKGVVDAAHYVLDRRDGFVLNDVMSLPFMGWPSQMETAKIYVELRNKFPAMRGEWKNVIPYVFAMMPPTHIHNVKKVVKTPADLKGMKIHTAEASTTVAAAAAGATPVNLDIADMYMSLDRGLLEGVWNHFPVLFVFGSLKLLEFHTIFGDGGVNMIPMGIVWNEEKWNTYPPDIQKTIMESSHFYTDKFYEFDLGLQKKCLSDVKEWKHTLTYLTPEEIKPWYNLVKAPIHDKWMEDAKTKNLPGKEVYEAALNLIKK